MEALEQIKGADVTYAEVSKYPGVTIDLSLIVDKSLLYKKIVDDIREYQCDDIREVRLIDIFEDQKLLPGKKSVTVRLEFSSMERTLEGAEIQAKVDELLVLLNKKGIELRK